MPLQLHKLTQPTAAGWVSQCVGEQTPFDETTDSDGVRVREMRSNHFSFIEIEVPAAEQMDVKAFENAVAQTYGRLESTLARHGHRYPIRFWNFVPAIGQRMSDGHDRYEHFNMARHAACAQWWGPEAMQQKLAAASGVSNTTDAYVVQVLAADAEGKPVENPRQIPAYRYSHRYGPKPPCFARATVVHQPEWHSTPVALLAGTAAVRGEDSQCQGDLAGQFKETCQNMASLIACAEGDLEPTHNGAVPARLAQLQEMRVYVSEDRHVEEVLESCDQVFGHGPTIEWMVTGLCRPELWVEIEGIAVLDGGA